MSMGSQIHPNIKYIAALRDFFYTNNRIPFPALNRKKRAGRPVLLNKRTVLSDKRRGSLTVEAALVLPLFLFAMLLVGYLGMMIRCQDEVQWALTRTAREAAVEYAASGSRASASKPACLLKLNRYLGGGGLPVSLSDSRLLTRGDEIDLVAEYQVKLPFHLLPMKSVKFRQRVRTRAFTGVESRAGQGGGGNVTVYITATGRVYHRDRKCPYLKLTISQVKYSDLPALRNEGGSIYRPCEKCSEGKIFLDGQAVWVTNYGDRFHSAKTCGNIRRDIQKVKLSEAGGRTPCSKCGS